MAEDALKVSPGDTFEIKCGEGHSILTSVGVKIPEQKPAFVILHVEANRALVGPLQAGAHELSLSCEGEETTTLKVELTPVEQKDLPGPAPALMPQTLGYAYLLGILFLLALIIAAVVTFFWKHYRKRQARRVTMTPFVEQSPAEKLQAFLREARKGGWVQSQDPQIVRRLYNEGYDLLRAYLETGLHFRAPVATTREFLGELKAAHLKPASAPTVISGEASSPARLKMSSELLGQIEAALQQADQVRFASDQPTPEAREGFLKILEKVRG